jgi:hypothetical protein
MTDKPKKPETKRTKPEEERLPPIRVNRLPGILSNSIITRRNGGVRHQFIDDIGGCSANYR